MDGYKPPAEKPPRKQNTHTNTRWSLLDKHLREMNQEGWSIVSVVQSPFDTHNVNIFWERYV